jgi:uncharacterized damage-inducible protein DinB
MSRTLLTDAFAHHVWATLRVIDVCLPLSPDQLASGAQGTYGSIIETLRHLVGADASYLSVLTDGNVAPIDEQAMELPELRAAMESHAPVWASLVAQNLDPDEMVVRHRDDGSESRAPRSIRVAQVLHHGTDHRSQVCTMLTTLGIDPPLIDVWDFAEQDGRLVETLPTA